MYFMNSPTVPGQNSKGENAAMRVMVEAITGPAMRCDASENANVLSMPSPMRRSAYSVTIIASSTSMPTAKIRLKSTTRFTVRPAICRPRMPIKNDAGIARPIKIEDRTDSEYKMIIKTNITAVRTEFCRSLSSCRMVVDLSWLNDTTTPSGSCFCRASVTSFT